MRRQQKIYMMQQLQTLSSKEQDRNNQGKQKEPLWLVFWTIMIINTDHAVSSSSSTSALCENCQNFSVYLTLLLTHMQARICRMMYKQTVVMRAFLIILQLLSTGKKFVESGFPSLCKLFFDAAFTASMISAAFFSFYAVIGLRLFAILAIVAPVVAVYCASSRLVTASSIQSCPSALTFTFRSSYAVGVLYWFMWSSYPFAGWFETMKERA